LDTEKRTLPTKDLYFSISMTSSGSTDLSGGVVATPGVRNDLTGPPVNSSKAVTTALT
jgi:hypothetical protein